jgi:uncharacterized protein (DUF2147 family)
MRTRWLGLIGPIVVFGAMTAWAQGGGVLGTWQEPGGAKIDVHRCGEAVCLKVLTLSRDAPSTVDGKNPDAALRTRPIVGLEIGQGFHLEDANHAEDGKLYDPKSGKTYNGTMTSEGSTMRLRGYVGIKLFGRTEEWKRVSGGS